MENNRSVVASEDLPEKVSSYERKTGWAMAKRMYVVHSDFWFVFDFGVDILGLDRPYRNEIKDLVRKLLAGNLLSKFGQNLNESLVEISDGISDGNDEFRAIVGYIMTVLRRRITFTSDKFVARTNIKEFLDATLKLIWRNLEHEICYYDCSPKDPFVDSCYEDLLADHMYYYPRHLGLLFHRNRFEWMCNESKNPERVLKMIRTNVWRSIDLNNKHGSDKLTLQQLVVAAATNKKMDHNAVYFLISMDPIAALFPKAKKVSRVGKKRKPETQLCQQQQQRRLK